ncbi:unnamed protein product [Anisakis simplex]|uniref:Vesicular, overexpressed in cancer, prosurvival protein 1 n=1 Tax=Anisakis simplex TaxID=6269 RepID=A0A0M3J8A1_ANISI|nr:unnamed protein product [Anisakis simplex]
MLFEKPAPTFTLNYLVILFGVILVGTLLIVGCPMLRRCFERRVFGTRGHDGHIVTVSAEPFGRQGSAFPASTTFSPDLILHPAYQTSSLTIPPHSTISQPNSDASHSLQRLSGITAANSNISVPPPYSSLVNPPTAMS